MADEGEIASMDKDGKHLKTCTQAGACVERGGWGGVDVLLVGDCRCHVATCDLVLNFAPFCCPPDPLGISDVESITIVDESSPYLFIGQVWMVAGSAAAAVE